MKSNILLHPYHPGVKFRNFANLDRNINDHYDLLYDTVDDFNVTPRYIYELGLKLGFRDMFYYIDALYNNHPESVVDVGCGECVWKRWFPNITGFDPNTNKFSNQDFVDFFDSDFSQGHKEAWHNGMAINSLHFIDWSYINTQLDLAMNIVKERFLFTFKFEMINNRPTSSATDLVYEFRDIIDRSGYTLLMFDAPILRGVDQARVDYWAFANGNVRFIISK